MSEEKKKLMVLTGAGVSAESGIPTFRGAGGLWEGFRIEDVASPDGWRKDPANVLQFYNDRRKNIKNANPNRAHIALAELEKDFDVQIITQNIDDLHERAGSKNVLHLHGEILKSRSTKNEKLLYDCNDDINIGDKCEVGSQLRPHIVWFGETVPMIEQAAILTAKADILLIIGTSMQVYPAASLLHYAPPYIPVYIIDPDEVINTDDEYVHVIRKNATDGMKEFVKLIENKN